MIRIGIIGYGSMGSMLLSGFIRSGAAAPEELIVSTRTESKLTEIQRSFPGIKIAGKNSDVAGKAKYVFVCVEPRDIKNVLMEIRDALTPDSVVISIAGTISIKNVEDLTHAKVIKLIPSLASEVLEGVSLVCFGGRVTADEGDYIEKLLNGIGSVKRIREQDFGLATELTSCAPGFFASILDEFVKSALRQNSALSEKDAVDMVVQTFYGTAKVLVVKNMGFQDMIQRVATKGGITEEGVKIFETDLPATFDRVFEATLEKRKRLSEKAEQEFDGD